MRKQININMSDGVEVYSYIYSSDTIVATKAIVLCHGMAEHIDRYDEFANKLVENGFIVLGYNQRGHKFTSLKDNYGYMGDMDNFNILVSDLKEMIIYLEDNYKLPTYLFGHSMGSFVSSRFIELYGNMIKGVVLCGTGRNPNLILNLGAFIASIIALFKGKHYRSKLIDNMSFGSFNAKFKPNRTDFDWLGTDNAEVDKYIEDEYCGGIFTVKYFHDFFKGCVKVNNNLKKIPKYLPILLISGDQDPVGNMGKSVNKLYDKMIKIKIDSVTKKFIKGERHEIMLNNPTGAHTFILNWLKNN